MKINWGMLACGISLFMVCHAREYDEDSMLEHVFTGVGLVCAILLIYFSKGEICLIFS